MLTCSPGSFLREDFDSFSFLIDLFMYLWNFNNVRSYLTEELQKVLKS